MSPKIVLLHNNLSRADAVHRKIPEFDPEYIKNSYHKKDIAAKNPYFIVAQVDGTDAAYMIGYDAPDSMYLWLNGTIPNFRRQGLFRVMLDDLSDEAKRRGHSVITVKTYQHFTPMLGALANVKFVQTKTEESSILLSKYL